MLDFLRRLSAREKIFLAAAALFVGFSLLWRLFLAPALDEGERMRSAAARKRVEMGQFQVLRSQYQGLKDKVGRIESSFASGGDFSLITYLEAQAREAGVGGRIASMKPQRTELESKMAESSVEVRMDKVNLKEAVEFLRRVESAPRPIRVKRMHLKNRFDDPTLMDATFLVSTLEAPKS